MGTVGPKIVKVYTLISLINVGLQINEGSGTNGGPGIFVALYKEVFENSHFFMTFFKNRQM